LATTPAGYGRFIGRVGALAVALGIGAAIANSPGIVWAQDGSSGASDSSSGATGTSNAGSTTGASGPPGSAATGSTDDSDPSGDDADADDDSEDSTGEKTSEGDTDEDEDEPADDDSSGSTVPEDSDETLEDTDDTSDTRSGRDDDSLTDDVDTSQAQSRTAWQTVVTSTDTDDDVTNHGMRIAADTDSAASSAVSTFAPIVPQSAQTSTRISSPATAVTTGIGGLFNTALSALGFGSQAASGPVAPPQPPLLWAMLGWVRRELGHIVSPLVSAAAAPAAALVADDVSVAADSPLATPEQLAAEKLATQTANSLPVALMKLVLRQQFLDSANKLYPEGVDAENLAAVDKAVNEYAMGAAFQQLLLNSMTPKFIAQVAPPHIWFGQNVPGSRILYDNPDTIYRFTGVNGASEYEIRGQIHNYSDVEARPANITFSVLEGLAGTTSTVLTVDDEFEIDEDGNFVITVSRAATGGPNHLQLTNGSTIIAARDTLGDWNDETPMSLSIERVGGPPNSLFAQIGGFAFLGNLVAGNPVLTTLVSLVPPLPYMPPLLRGVFSAAILIVRGAEQAKYMALATTDPATGEARPVNTVSQPASNAEFLANQKQSNGHFQLEDGQALVLTIDPGDAKYFIVPTYDIWTITDNYWDEPTSLNNEQMKGFQNADGTYTVVISPTDPLAANWVSTGGLNQGTIAIRFQDLDPKAPNQPQIVDQRVLTHEELSAFLPADAFITKQVRDEQLELRKAGFDKRWAPFAQP
jgi:hypothetical protein